MTSNKQALSRKDLVDYEFILQEAARMAKLTIEEIINHNKNHPEDMFCSLPVLGRGSLPFTRAGDERFQQICTRGLRAMGSASRKHDPKKVFESLKSEFSSYNGEPEITEDSAHFIFENAISKLENRFYALTHFVPCSVVIHNEPSRFKIGPVHFTRRDLFLTDHEEALRAEELSMLGFEWGFEALRKFFNQFYWVAAVTIEKADEAVSRGRARKVIQMALDVLKLTIGSRRGAGIRQAYDLGAPAHTATLVSAAGKGFSPSLENSNGDAVIGDDWYATITNQESWSIIETILQSYFATWEDLPEPYQRFLDALRWHGEGISDPEPQSRVVKFWIAIERLVSLRSKDAVTRKAALLSSWDLASFPSRLETCERLYGKRSAIAHGFATRDAEESKALGFECEQLSRTVFGSYLSLMQNLQLKACCNRAGLAQEFELLEQQLSNETTTAS